jgi:hypothetical protein
LYVLMCCWVSIIKFCYLYLPSWGHFDTQLHTHMHTDLKSSVSDICIRLSPNGLKWL